MSVIIFIIILLVLIVTHEWGHFVVAKFFKIRVDEFGIGFPPRIKKLFHYKGTDYTLNWIPFGGFVKIYGENYDSVVGQNGVTPKDSFVAKPKYVQALVLIAGIVMNFLVGWLLISFTLLGGVTASTADLDDSYIQSEPQLMVIDTIPHSPAATAGIIAGDIITSISTDDDSDTSVTSESLIHFINEHKTSELTVTVKRNKETFFYPIQPSIEENGDAKIGISMDTVSQVKLPFFRAFTQGMKTTLYTTKQIITGFVGLFSGGTNLSSVTGPVGIAGIIGDAARIGFAQVLSLMAIISLNLAVINLVPFPALDGGRLLFVGIEAVTRKQVPLKVFQWANTIGFFILIALMILVTVRDVIHLF